MPNTCTAVGVHSDGFGFTINGTGGLTVVVEAATNVAATSWLPLSTNTLFDGSSYFVDPDWKNHSARFYRVRPYEIILKLQQP